MALESWLPIGFALPDGARCGRPLYTNVNWQILQTKSGGSALVVREDLFAKWVGSGLIDETEFLHLSFGLDTYRQMSCGSSQMLVPISDCCSPSDKNEALAFATALRETRAIDPSSPLQDAVYVEKFSRLLPSYGITSRTDDGIVLGYWLTGGAKVSAKSFRRLRQMLTWMETQHLQDIVKTAGISVSERTSEGQFHTAEAKDLKDRNDKHQNEAASYDQDGKLDSRVDLDKPFELPGRPELEAFFNEQVVDIIRNKERYKALGVEFPSAIVLHGPPGCGKTFAIEQLIEYLGWPSFQIDASSVASPYIHETSRKVSAMFDKAMQNAPAVLVIDEMEAFLAHRETGGGESHHRVEEVAEFLRRIPEAAKKEVLIVAMTNRVEMIDSAIMRRGRFDHVIKVDYADENEVLALLNKLLSTLPNDGTVDPASLSKKLAWRPLSDVTFVVREGARLSVRAGCDKLGQEYLLAALDAAPSRTEEGCGHRIGFV